MSTTKNITNAFLKGKMTDAMVFRGEISNLDECKQTGFYSLSPSLTVSANPPNIPSWNYGIVEVFPRYGVQVFQRITTAYGVSVERIWNTSWSSWQKIVKETV